MKLNRWTILAAILLLSTAVGLLFRPWGPAEGPPQTVENQGLSLTCPEVITAAPGSNIELQCEVTNSTRYQQYDYYIRGHISRKWDEPHNYIPFSDVSVVEIGRNRYLTTGHVWIYRDDSIPTGASLHSWSEGGLLSTDSQVNIEVRHPLFYYPALGLLLLQMIALGGFTVVCMLFASWGSTSRQLGTAQPKFVLTAYRAIDVLWLTYFTQALLMLVFHIWDYQAYISQPWDPIFPPQLLYILTLPFALGVIVLLFVVGRLTMRSNGMSSVWEKGATSEQDNSPERIQSSWTPLVGAIVTGWVFLLLAFWVYLSYWL